MAGAGSAPGAGPVSPGSAGADVPGMFGEVPDTLGAAPGMFADVPGMFDVHIRMSCSPSCRPLRSAVLPSRRSTASPSTGCPGDGRRVEAVWHLDFVDQFVGLTVGAASAEVSHPRCDDPAVRPDGDVCSEQRSLRREAGNRDVAGLQVATV